MALINNKLLHEAEHHMITPTSTPDDHSEHSDLTEQITTTSGSSQQKINTTNFSDDEGDNQGLEQNY